LISRKTRIRSIATLNPRFAREKFVTVRPTYRVVDRTPKQPAEEQKESEE